MKRIRVLFLTLGVLVGALTVPVQAAEIPVDLANEPPWAGDYVLKEYDSGEGVCGPALLDDVALSQMLETRLRIGDGSGDIYQVRCEHCEDRCRIDRVPYSCPVTREVCRNITIVRTLLSLACARIGAIIGKGGCMVITDTVIDVVCEDVNETGTCMKIDYCAYTERYCWDVPCGD